MKEEQPIRSIEPNALIENAGGFHKQGYRFVQVCATKLDENAYELTYSFDKDYKLENLRVTITPDIVLPSITEVYKGAFLYENEITELFGLKFKGMNVDYNGHFYKKKMERPFSVDTNKVDEACQKE